MAGTPENIVMLTADAFGVLPPISRLTPEQAMYHFLSGYTAKVAGTEKGVTEPQATFTTCFGAPFLPRHPTVYAEMLGEKMARQHVEVLAGQHRLDGRRLRRRRAHVDPAHPRHGARGAGRRAGRGRAARPTRTSACRCRSACPGVPGEVLNPKNTWKDKKAYDSAARDVAQRFEANFQQFESHVDGKVKQAAIRAAA